ncbi:Cyclic pyranopterin monophosphate synthase [Pseudobythopirellula maris]|uniref:GTP 3',8-cyclase n=1 Tax=Pseudobythopirellula maris TaxID=2527991 RepID=A0A5C5ZT90_9BACT|nr:GTP 3',8-cyclase MoaA [Pseudobythopirellula maris]TWT90460.1 Cyclic pyranopterin monophosphate synthase [Pseudobythopirellula maris]
MSRSETNAPLVDRFGRTHTSMRLSVTDRCNLRCQYCMPDGPLKFLPRAEVLTFEEITRLVAVAATMGVRKLRLTGGEPLVRSELPRLVTMLRTIDGVDEIALTTNALLLAEQAEPLRRAGLDRLNVSLDTVRDEPFREISRRDGLGRVLAGLEAAGRAGFTRIRLNAIAMRGFTEAEAPHLARFARAGGYELRFIEYMPLDADGGWQADQVLSGAELRELLAAEFGPLEPSARPTPSQPATDYRWTDVEGPGAVVGFINPVSEPFCDACDRLRLTAEGQVRNCLFSTEEWDARELLRSGADDNALRQLLSDCVAAKKRGHGIDDAEFVRPERAMYQIGG